MTQTTDSPSSGSAVCPRCGQAGRAVSAVTLEAMLLPAARQRLAPFTGFRFCATPHCDVAYFNPTSGELVLQGEVPVPIFQKSAEPRRRVCYCFGHTVEAVQSEVRAHGASGILDDIRSKCRQGLDACERKNPQGSCCLGNVQRLVREAGAGAASPATAGCGCCGSGRDASEGATRPTPPAAS